MTAAIFCAACLLLAFTASAEADDRQAPAFTSAHSRSYKHCPRDGWSVNFPAFFLGGRFEGLDKTARTRRCDRPRRDEPIRANYVNYSLRVVRSVAARLHAAASDPELASL